MITTNSNSESLDKKSFARFLSKQGKSSREIADILSVGKSTVCNWLIENVA